MLLETDTLRVDCAGPIATLRLAGASLAEFDRALDLVAANPFVEILVLRDFEIGPSPALDPTEFALGGRRVLAKLESLPVTTLADLDAALIGRGWEIALACDWRLALATPDTRFGLGDSPCWGGTARTRRLAGTVPSGPLSAREARELGLVDRAFCERRAKIELRTWLDRLELRPTKRRASRFGWRRELRLNEDELREYLRLDPPTANDGESRGRGSGTGPAIASIELRSCPQAVPFAVEFVLRGGTVVTDDPEALGEYLEEPLLRGRVTPLELERARDRVKSVGRAQLRLEGESRDPFAIVRATLAPHAEPIRLGFPVLPDGATVELTAGTATDAIASAFQFSGYSTVPVPDAPSLSVRPLLASYWDEAVRLVADGFPIDLIDEASRAVSLHAPLRTLDRLGLGNAVSLVPRLRPFVEAGLREAFYHADRPREANALAQILLPTAPRLLMDDDERDEADGDAMRREIECRFVDRCGKVAREVANAAGFKAMKSERKVAVQPLRKVA